MTIPISPNEKDSTLKYTKKCDLSVFATHKKCLKSNAACLFFFLFVMFFNLTALGVKFDFAVEI